MFLENYSWSVSYRWVLVFHCILFLALTVPFWIFGEVVAPHRQQKEVGANDSRIESSLRENRKFSDYTSAFIPEITQNLNGARSGWLTLWSNENELGRPTFHLAGFSSAYFPSWVIAQFTSNPWEFATVFSLLTCFLAGVFFIFFCKEIGLSPIAAVFGGSMISASPFFMYWLTFPMFLATLCWATGTLWSITRLAKRPDLIGWLVLTFAIFSLLLVARKQAVVTNAYILTGYSAYLVFQQLKLGRDKAILFSVLAVSAVFTGLTLSLPVFIDLAYQAAESARTAPDTSFFMAVLPEFTSFIDVVRFFVLSTTPELFGNPVDAYYPFLYNGISFTPLIVFFAVIGLLVSFRKTWGWWLAISVLCLFAFIHPLFELAIEYLGFNLSRSNPFAHIMLPLTIIAAYGVNALVQRNELSEHKKAMWIAAATVLVVIAIGVYFGFSQGVPIRRRMLLAMLVLVGLLVVQYKKRHPVLLLTAMIIVLVTISYPLMLRQDPSQIARTSPLVEKVRANLPAGSRFAIAAPGLSVLSPNLNAGLGLSSLHSYNSLSSKRYHRLIQELGGETKVFGRWNVAISPDYNSTMFWMSNISLMLSPTKLTHENLEYLGEESGVYLHKVISKMGDSIQVMFPRKSTTAAEMHVMDPRLLPTHSPSRLLDQGDRLEFEVAFGAPSVLVLSQKFHRDWKAQVLIQSRWISARTTAINDVFQGVILPSDTRRVRLEFKPYVRYAWVAHVFWLLLLALLGFTILNKRRKPSAESLSTK